MSAAPVLITLMGDRVVGHVEQNLQGKLRFTYDQAWRDWPGAYPLSLSMPVGLREHEDEKIRPYLEGLLPDNEWILRRWGSQFHVSARNPFTLLAHVGEDCAGAVQFCRPDRVAELLANADPPVRWVSEAQIAATLRELRTDNATGRVAADPGYFSLPGAQPKTALLLQDGRWGIPSGRTPTTHILKPPLGDLEGFAENEHLCLRLAAALGMPVAHSEVRRFDGEIAIVVERYDRVALGERIARVHQEDFCQALSVSPRIKYEAEGGPGAGAMARVLRDFSSAADEDLDTLLTALTLNWVIGGTDAHAKNFSLLIAARQVRLAPLYDIASVLPYPRRIPLQKANLALRVGGEYRLVKIGRRHWERLVREMGLGTDAMDRVHDVVDAVPDRMEEVCAAARAEGINHPVVETLEKAVRQQAAACLSVLDRRAHD
ncbi:type II toxin-antitoxin system HipA family toxin [Longimicrobium sp.]|uniref:type II toxin-antitoxin system HipA family toxin n=1 Tax=Longimicrobium sp. TaxID=2029185 RepID=UPI003B3A716F